VEEEKMMKRSVFFSLLGSGIVCLALAAVGKTSVPGTPTVPRAFVSTTGSDTNPCSAAQPCRSFNQALTAVQPGGEIVVQDSGGYSTGFTITKSVTIDGGGVDASVISLDGTDLCTINAGPADTVVLRGISFHGARFGLSAAINATHVGSLYVDHCSISEFTGDGVRMPNGGNLFITGTDVRACTSFGVVMSSGSSPANLVAHDSRFTECFFGGVSLSAGAAAATGSLTDCTVSVSNDTAIEAACSGTGNADMTLTNCRAIGNGIGIAAVSSSTGRATIDIANCTVTQNTSGIFTASTGGGTASVIGTSPGTNRIARNGSGNSVSVSETLQ
jgi:hypothetical protein